MSVNSVCFHCGCVWTSSKQNQTLHNSGCCFPKFHAYQRVPYTSTTSRSSHSTLDLTLFEFSCHKYMPSLDKDQVQGAPHRVHVQAPCLSTRSQAEPGVSGWERGDGTAHHPFSCCFKLSNSPSATCSFWKGSLGPREPTVRQWDRRTESPMRVCAF